VKYDLAIFDMDGTIIDSMWIWKDLVVDSFKRNGIDIPENFEQAIFSMTFLESAQYYIEVTKEITTPEQLIEEWSLNARLMYKNDITLKPFTEEFLIYLKSLGITICLTTSNFKDIAVMILKRFSLLSYFDSITVTQEVTRSKSFPDVFLITASKHHVNPEKCIVFEDSYYAAQGAKAAGMAVVGVYDEYAKHFEDDFRQLADSYVYSFEELYKNDEFFKG